MLYLALYYCVHSVYSLVLYVYVTWSSSCFPFPVSHFLFLRSSLFLVLCPCPVSLVFFIDLCLLVFLVLSLWLSLPVFISSCVLFGLVLLLYWHSGSDPPFRVSPTTLLPSVFVPWFISDYLASDLFVWLRFWPCPIKSLFFNALLCIWVLTPFHSPLQHVTELLFIKNYSTVVAPLMALTSMKTSFQWTLNVAKAFEDLKNWFTSAPILMHLDSEKQFIVEVAVSDAGVEAILSQQSSKDDNVHSFPTVCLPLSKIMILPIKNF